MGQLNDMQETAEVTMTQLGQADSTQQQQPMQPQQPQQQPQQVSPDGYPMPPQGQQPQAGYPMPPQQWQQGAPEQPPYPYRAYQAPKRGNGAAKVFKVALLVLPLSLVAWFVVNVIVSMAGWFVAQGSGVAPAGSQMVTRIVSWLIGVVWSIDIPVIVVSGIVALVTRDRR